MSKFQNAPGTFDLLPPDSAAFLGVREAMTAPLRAAGYDYIETPTFESTALFKRGVGESTDIVTKEMYSFTTRGGDDVTLRPEGTASVLRAALQANLIRGSLPVKLWYSGSFYRYEKQQRGRYRHFSQVGAEALGAEDPALDAELLIIGDDIYRGLGLTEYSLLLNSLGDQKCRPVYREKLQEFLRGLDLDEETRKRAEINPLRVLDDKREAVQRQLTGVPLISDNLCEECRAYHEEVRRLLTAAGVKFLDDPKLVRGLDYYTRTTFEYVHSGITGSPTAIGAGGRYDGLSEELGGPSLPSVGWALGVDRTVLALHAEGREVAAGDQLDVFAVPLGDQAREVLFELVTTLRRSGVAADFGYGSKGIKAAMKAADRSGARYALVLGERDIAENIIQIKELATGEQESVSFTDIVTTIQEKLK
ncbi:histidyl-tRNA synthetase [Catenulispora acidiphila DSM 44928]|uniref:Histidine--tRNA ligase n=1 Tax=Catenulispora acidiphila (strain DSM 44928 / JCM 14897 / NBRC 102108 / NRRL B-24433 / ID139908) TaxID=479433 RepID=C7PVP1_CATAD|nr:histidine--tRNA ligase [Catenulispora acidiphila]ACU71283.1 histidyl-tRNA synthetase [Catenulispora acidiphila DSM 44928]